MEQVELPLRAGHQPPLGPVFDDVVEMSFLVPARQAAELEDRAHRRGLTAAQVLRQLIRGFTEAPIE